MHRHPEYCRTLVPGDPLEGVVAEISDALAHGNAVTLTTHAASVTTQEAADMLGISRPTLVRLLEAGQIPFEQPGRHRRVRVQDVLAFQARRRHGGTSAPGPEPEHSDHPDTSR